MSEPRLTTKEIQFLQEALGAGYKICNIRLRKGEHQYDLAKAIASFQLGLYLPDVKDIIERLYGEEKSSDTKFIRKIQTILKKMEKSNVVRILRGRSWRLQRYALSSFKFHDVDKNLVNFATDQQIKRVQSLLHSVLSQQEKRAAKMRSIRIKTCILVFIVVTSYTAILWDLLQPTINSIIFVPAFSIAVACSFMLGKILSQK